jgi:hypothetical protein
MVVEDREMPLRLELIAVVGAIDLLRREVLEVSGLAAERSDAGGVPARSRAPGGMRWVPIATLKHEALPNVMRKVIAHGLSSSI